MTLPVKQPQFSTAPEQYDRRHMETLLAQLRTLIRELNTPGPIAATTILLSELPESENGDGLRLGTVYRTAAGDLKVKV